MDWSIVAIVIAVIALILGVMVFQRVSAIHHKDGNTIIKAGPNEIWAQKDGNLVIYKDMVPVWNSVTAQPELLTRGTRNIQTMFAGY
jgi:hypothetical protein